MVVVVVLAAAVVVPRAEHTAFDPDAAGKSSTKKSQLPNTVLHWADRGASGRRYRAVGVWIPYVTPAASSDSAELPICPPTANR